MQVERFRQSPIGSMVPISGHDTRFGERYEHWAYVPAPLPIGVDLSARTWSAVAEAMQALGRLDQAGRQVPDPGLLRWPTLRREAQSTSALEGTYAPLGDVLELDPADDVVRPPAVREVLNYVAAAEHAFAAVTDRPLSVQLVLELQALLVHGVEGTGADAGRVRTRQVVIGAPTGRVRDARFVPPPPGPGLEAALRDWVDWVNRPHPDMPVVVAAALAHYQFEALHPFTDGNGRIGRLLIVVHLLLAGALHEPLLTVSPWFEARRTDYQDELARLSEAGDWDRWVLFFATAIRDRAAATIATVDALVAFAARAAARCRAARVRGLALDVAEALIARPVLTPRGVQRHYGVAYHTANAALAKLAEFGLVREATGGTYARVFIADEVMDVLRA